MSELCPDLCPYCRNVPCIGDDCPRFWLCVSCGVNLQVPPWAECADCRELTERMTRHDHDEYGDDYDPADDESWMEDYP